MVVKGSKKNSNSILKSSPSSSKHTLSDRNSVSRSYHADRLIDKFIKRHANKTPEETVLLVVQKQSVFNIFEQEKPRRRRKRPPTKYERFKKKFRHYRTLLAAILLLLHVTGGAAIFWRIETSSVEELNEFKAQILNQSRILYKRIKPSDPRCGALQPYDSIKNNPCLAEIHRTLYNSNPPKMIQSYWDGLNYVLTSITTIGYGNLICYSTAGKMFTVVYAITGIGLLLYVLRNNGRLTLRFCNKMLNFFSMCCCFCSGDRREQTMTVTKGIVLLLIFWSVGTLGIAIFSREFSFSDSIYFSFITFSTIGFGDFVPIGHVSGAIVITLHFIDLSLISMVFALVHESMENNFMEVLEILDEGFKRQTAVTESPGVSPDPSKVIVMNTARDRTPIRKFSLK